MKIRVFLITAALVVSIACGSERRVSETAVPSPTPVQDELTRKEQPVEKKNLAGLVNGGVVVERSGELNLEASAVQAIDQTRNTAWITPPKDPRQEILIRLPVESRITKVGYTTRREDEISSPPKAIAFDASADGAAFREIKVIENPGVKLVETTDVSPVRATFLRVRIPDTEQVTASIASVIALGEEVSRWTRPDVTGEWKINDQEGRFLQHGARVTGTISMNPPMRIEGGWDGRTVRFAWTRARQWGLGIISVSPDARSLNAEWWYEEAIPLFYGMTWFGSRTSPYADTQDDWSVARTWLERFGRFPLFGIAFAPDGGLDATGSAQALRWLGEFIRENPSARLTLFAREYQRDSPEENQKLSERHAESLHEALEANGIDVRNVTFSPVGATRYKEVPSGIVEQPVFSRIELELARSMKE